MGKKSKSMSVHITTSMAMVNSIKEKKEIVGKYIG